MINEKQKKIFEKLQPYAVGLLLGLGLTALVGLVAVSCSPHTTTPTASPLTVRQPKDALTPPTGYDFGYRYFELESSFMDWNENASNARSVYYSRSSDGSYYNYFSETVSVVSGLTYQLTFRHSNTAWYHEDYDVVEPYSWYPSPSTPFAIGSDGTVGSVVKWEFTFNNQTKHDYKLIFDLSSSNLEFSYLCNFNGTVSRYYYYLGSLNYLVIPAYTNFTIFSNGATALVRYFDAFFLDDLGVSTAYTNGYNAGYEAGYDAGYDAGYLQGNGDGILAGYESGHGVGYDEGYSAGYTLGYSEGSDFGYTQHELDGGIMGFIGRVFDTVATFLNIEVFDGITLGALILWPLVLAVLFFMLKMFKSGD